MAENRLQKVIDAAQTAGDQCPIGLPDFSKGQKSMHNVLKMMEDQMPADMRKQPVHLIKIEAFLGWTTAYMYEEVKASDMVDVPYVDVAKSGVWDKIVILSWRWSHLKPRDMTPGFSLMSSDQLSGLQSMMKAAKTKGAEYIWIDCSCVPQYSVEIMSEVLRSKFCFARARFMVILPTFAQQENNGSRDSWRLEKIARPLLGQVCDNLKKQEEGSKARQAVRLIVQSFYDGKPIAKQEYFGRAWTLAERLARYGKKDRLCDWIPLEWWLGIIIDCVIDGDSGVYKHFLEKGSSKKTGDMFEILCKKVGGMTEENCLSEIGSSLSLAKDLSDLLEDATIVWATYVSEEGTSKEWLKHYLTVSIPNMHYKAWNKSDWIWAIYSYFKWTDPVKTNDGLIEAVFELAQVAGIKEQPIANTKILPSLYSTYKALDLSDAAKAVEPEEVARARKAEEAKWKGKKSLVKQNTAETN